MSNSIKHQSCQNHPLFSISVSSCSNLRLTVMHETSLVRALIRQIEQIAVENVADGVERVRVELGPLSGVEPALVDLAWQQLAPESICRDAALILEEVLLRCRCRACDEEFEVPDIHLECPACGSQLVQVTGGDEFRLLDVTIRERIAAEGQME